MKFLADENVKSRLVKHLLENGHDVSVVPKGASDKSIALLASDEGRILLTHDMDFADTLRFPPSMYAGIVLLRVFPPTLEMLTVSLDKLLNELSSPDEFNGRLITLESDRFWVET